ncbi:MAG: DNA polymerase III subunit gamma/tau [Dissulfurimicrobium sp.]|uniref:DNA polymerase III subunit gamma/tau n=1 Tax=Dissulfurimicrobium TaxID=1769732 RepID=UPI001ED9D19E|nr:DNA polymerase III subunit gamma/tau [Dissulfurimicrobium hydrothermale]UKL13946.1 DNA polymerase III subunit gamma/tau [Dissulfurimicrobium hydrothermale]
MSYLVLARKWRPQTFEDVAGQRHVTRTLQNSIEMGRLSHAMIFSGARGVGKTSVARILAKAINCEAGPAKNPCNRCVQCVEITEGRSVDVQEIDAASNRGIDEIRLLKENSRFHPSFCRCRVYIIDEAHMLTKEAFNALLKTLEEPPDHVYFILATTEPQKIPVTIHSRCQHHVFKRLGAAALAAHVDKIAHAEGLRLDREVIMLLAREAGGSVRDALSLLDQVVAFGASSLEEVCEALGVISSQVMRDMAGAVIKGDVAGMLSILDDVQGYGVDLKRFASDLTLYLRDMLVVKELGPERADGLVVLSREDINELSPLLSDVSPNGLMQMLDAMMKGLDAIGRSSTPRISLEILLMRLIHMRDAVKIDEILRRLNELRSPVGSEAVSPASSSVSNSTSMDSMEIKTGSIASTEGPAPLSGGSWEDFLCFTRKRSQPLASKLVCCKQVNVDENNGIIRLLCVPGMHYDLLSERDNISRLQDLAREFYKRPVSLVVEVLKKEDEASGSMPNGSKKSSARDELLSAPLVKKAIKVFDARIMDVKLFPDKDRDGSF